MPVVYYILRMGCVYVCVNLIPYQDPESDQRTAWLR